MSEYETFSNAIWSEKIIDGINHQIAEIKALKIVASDDYVFTVGESGNLVITPKASDAD
jgi:hypothetical protein